ncbi:GATA zinc finger, partial [Rhizoctonia solani]
MEDELRPLPDHDHEPDMRQRAHSVMPPRRSGTYDSRTDPRGPPQPRRQSTSAVGLPAPAPTGGWHSPPPAQPYYSQHDAFGAHAYIEPRAQPMPPPPPSWGYQLPPPQGYAPQRTQPPRSPPPSQYDPRYHRQPSSYPYPPSVPYGQPPYPPGPGGPTVDPTIFKPDPYGRPIPTSPPDPSRPDVQITYTDDSATKLTQYLRRRCFNCRVTEPPGWRKSTLNPGKIVRNPLGSLPSF